MDNIKKREEIADIYKWDLTLLVKNKKDYEKKYQKVEDYLEKIVALKGHLFDSSKTLLEYFEISTKMDKVLMDIYIWSNLYKYEDLNNSDANNYALNVEELYNKVAIGTSFVRVEFVKQSKDVFDKLAKEEPKLKEFKFWFESILKEKDHILSEKEEKLISKLTRSFGKVEDTYEILNDAENNIGSIMIDNKEIKITQSNFINLLKNADPKIREKVFKTYYYFYEFHKNTFSSLYNTNILEDNSIADIRGFDSSLKMALNHENIDDTVYENLLNSVNENMNLIFDYQNIRKKILGLKDYHIYDNYLDIEIDLKEKYDIEKCKEILIKALNPLKGDYLEKLKFMFSSNYIDYYPNYGKRSGAFQWNRYVCLNHIDSYESLTTMAHELGHAMNTLYTEEKQPLQYQSNPIFLAEIASTLNEVLLSEYLCQNAKSRQEKIRILDDFLSRVNGTIYRQTMFAEFEYLMHKSESEGISLTEEYMSNEYLKLVHKYFSKNIIIEPEIKYEWMRIPHFYSSFYVYKYAIGLICALIFAKRILNNEENAVEEYLSFLASGSQDYPLNILISSHIDLTKKEVFEEAFELIKEKIVELKEVIENE